MTKQFSVLGSEEIEFTSFSSLVSLFVLIYSRQENNIYSGFSLHIFTSVMLANFDLQKASKNQSNRSDTILVTEHLNKAALSFLSLCYPILANLT